MAEIDLASLPEAARAELAQLAELAAQESTPTGEEETPQERDEATPAATSTPRPRKPKTDDKPPAYVQALIDQASATNTLIQTLTESNRMVQGQVRALEARLSNQPQARHEDKPVADPLADVDDSDPAIAALVKHNRDLAAKLTRLEAQAQQSAYTAQEQAQRDGWLSYLETSVATPLGVSFADIAVQLKGIPTADLAVKGAEFIAAAAKKQLAKTPGNGEATDVATAVREAKAQLLKQLGIYDEVIQGAGGSSSDDAQFLRDFAAGKSNDMKRAETLLKRL